MAYQYDIFISYRRSEPPKSWLYNYFLVELEKQLRLHIPEPNIFIDKEEIKIGDAFNRKIINAIQSSKFFVPILSANYWLPDHYALHEYAYMLYIYEKLSPHFQHYTPILPILFVEPTDINSLNFDYWDLFKTKDIDDYIYEDDLRAWKAEIRKSAEAISKKIKIIMNANALPNDNSSYCDFEDFKLHYEAKVLSLAKCYRGYQDSWTFKPLMITS